MMIQRARTRRCAIVDDFKGAPARALPVQQVTGKKQRLAVPSSCAAGP